MITSGQSQEPMFILVRREATESLEGTLISSKKLSSTTGIPNSEAFFTLEPISSTWAKTINVSLIFRLTQFK